MGRYKGSESSTSAASIKLLYDPSCRLCIVLNSYRCWRLSVAKYPQEKFCVD